MKAKIMIAGVVAAAAALIPVASASAHPGAWFWKASTVERTIFQEDLYWDDGTVDTVEYIDCVGHGKRYKAMFKHFVCYVETAEWNPYYIRVHILGENDYRFDFLYDA
jgi:hypothetical protein